MIGRAAQGRPWIFREIEHYLETGEHLPQPEVAEIHAVMLDTSTTCTRSTAMYRRARRTQAHFLVHAVAWWAAAPSATP